MQTPIRWGIIGLGKIARKFADDLQRLPDAHLHAVASTSIDRAQAFAAEYQVPHAYGNYEDILTCPNIDVVYIATPHSGHTVNTMMCLEAGLPVLCEKPFAMCAADAQRMINLARQKGVFLMEAIWTRFIPGFQKALDLVDAGVIGKVLTVQSDFGSQTNFDPNWRLYNKALGGGALLDIGIYPVLFAQMLLGPPAASDIQATATFTTTGVDESCAFIFQYPGNRLALGHCTIVVNTPIEGRIFGEKGTILLHSRCHHPKGLTVSLYEGKEMRHEDILMPYEGWGYHFEAAHVMECLRAGRTESDLVPLSFTLDLANTLDTICQKIGLKY